MSIGFTQIPTALRTPLFYAELDPSHANSGQALQRTLIIGQKLTGGTATASVPVRCRGAADAKTLGGAGSVLALMVAAYLANDPAAEVWVLPLADDGAAVSAAGTVTFTGPSTAAGVLSLYVAGAPIPLPVTSGMTATQLATATAAAVNALTDLPVTAASAAGVVTLTARNAGLTGNDIDIRTNFLGSVAGEATPAGVTVAIVAMANGATAPSLTAGLAALGDQPFDFIVSPYTDATSLAALKALMSTTTGRWSYSSQVYGHVFGAYAGTYANQGTFGAALNDEHATFVGVYDSPTWRLIWAAAYAGACAQSLKADPAQPLQTVPVVGVLAPPPQSRLTQGQRNALLFEGVATFTTGQDGGVRVERAITTYQKNGFSQPDDSYLRLETMFTLMAVMRTLRSVVTSKFARVKLTDDGARLPPGANVVSPATIRGEIIAAYRTMVDQGLVEDPQGFAAALVVERDATNRNRVNVLWPGDLINGLEVFALLAQFRN